MNFELKATEKKGQKRRSWEDVDLRRRVADAFFYWPG